MMVHILIMCDAGPEQSLVLLNWRLGPTNVGI